MIIKKKSISHRLSNKLALAAAIGATGLATIVDGFTHQAKADPRVLTAPLLRAPVCQSSACGGPVQKIIRHAGGSSISGIAIGAAICFLDVALGDALPTSDDNLVTHLRPCFKLGEALKATSREFIDYQFRAKCENGHWYLTAQPRITVQATRRDGWPDAGDRFVFEGDRHNPVPAKVLSYGANDSAEVELELAPETKISGALTEDRARSYLQLVQDTMDQAGYNTIYRDPSPTALGDDRLDVRIGASAFAKDEQDFLVRRARGDILLEVDARLAAELRASLSHATQLDRAAHKRVKWKSSYKGLVLKGR